MRQLRPALRLTSLAAASGLLFASAAAQAQAAAPAPGAAASAPQTLETVVVTGIRQSLESSVNLKRHASGLVDGIVAEDIGKFPDTNLAEAMSRISGVSIDRANGEGTKVTVRGMGPDYNLVLLNGRQMPGSNIDGSAPSSRSFDFSNLASEGVSALEVYKTSRASSPTGGMGATINIRTPRPFDRKDTVASFGVKMVKDESAQRLPEPEKGKNATPEVSGIYSTQFADGKFGIALIGSYQERDSGYNSAAANNGWKSFAGIKDNNWSGSNAVYGGLPATSTEITNRPSVNSIYSVPQSFAYSFTGIHRERTNGQLVLQARPTQDTVATLDYTMSEQKFRQTRNDISAWFGFGNQFGSYETGAIASPIVYGEHMSGSDVAMGTSRVKTKNQNKSLGFNLQWKPTNALTFELDGHHSSATSGADDPLGTSVTIGTASMNRGDTSVDFSQKFPVLSIKGTQLDPSLMELQGSAFSNSYQRDQIDQWQGKGHWKIDDDSGLDFGLSLTKVNNRSAYTVVQRNVWGGGSSGGPAAMPDSIWHADTISRYFSRIPGSGNPALFNKFFYFNFDDVRNAAIKTLGSSLPYLASFDFDNSQGYGAKLAADPNNITSSVQDFRTTEKSQALYLQYNRGWEMGGIPFDAAVGGRYERTNVDSPSRETPPTSVVWNGGNEFGLVYSPNSTSADAKGKYAYFLPSIDLSADVTTNTKLRISYGSTIGRPGWASIQGGRTTDLVGRVDGDTGSMGNPGLKPLKSNNFDFSAEHYYAKGSYIAASFFHKSITNYISSTVVNASPYDVHTPAMGALFNEAVSTGGCGVSDLTCISQYIFTKHPTAAGVSVTGTDPSGKPIGTITGQPSDPTLVFKMTTPSNSSDKKSLNGIELNFQHTFSNGFGGSINFTRVRSGLTYKNGTLGDQTGTALVGLGDSGNVVAFYEDSTYSARVAYNWRGKYLSGNYGGAEGAQPLYTEPYGQVDVALGYAYNNHLSFQLEAINLTDQYTRTQMRDALQIGSVTQLGRRVMIGARYKF
ncbi:TonB-dependent receptor [Roseateles sp. BYS78W]|uniref:TonB-dependent receptor n=1 Tax=Pelomonas candidula TaxID=3299025 RepID=A0ABW7HFW9_9BURK